MEETVWLNELSANCVISPEVGVWAVQLSLRIRGTLSPNVENFSFESASDVPIQFFHFKDFVCDADSSRKLLLISLERMILPRLSSGKRVTCALSPRLFVVCSMVALVRIPSFTSTTYLRLECKSSTYFCPCNSLPTVFRWKPKGPTDIARKSLLFKAIANT